MTDVSSTIIVGECTLSPYLDVIQVSIHGQQAWWLTKAQFTDLMQAGQVLIERAAKVEVDE
jgi:hypothetical protein